MKILRWSLLSVLAILDCGVLAAGDESASRTTTNASPKQRSEDQQIRTFMMVEYDYKLEVNKTKTPDINFGIGGRINGTEGTESEDNIFDNSNSNNPLDNFPLENALLEIDTDIIPAIQERLPNGRVQEGKTVPDVQFNAINSRFINMCFTESDACKFVKSRIKLSFIGDRPMAAVERVTLDLVQQYFKGLNEENPSLNAEFIYPMIHSSTVKIDLSPVDEPMSEDDILHFETTFYNVYHAIVNAMDGDTDVSEVHYVYQDLEELKPKTIEDELVTPKNNLGVHMNYFGKCRYCSEEELAATVYGSFEPNKQAFLANLKKNNYAYFQQVQEISFSPSTPLDGLTTITPIDENAPRVNKKTPWFMYIGVGAAIFVLVSGVIVIAKDQKALHKEEASTSEESNSDSEKGDGTGSNDSSSLNTNTINKAGMHSDYEVYVY